MGRKKKAVKRVAEAVKAARAPAPAAHDPEIARVRALLGLMQEHALVELEIGPDGHSVRLSKTSTAPMGLSMAAPMVYAGGATGAPTPPAAAPLSTEAAPAKPAAPAGEKFLSPMVGTFYRAASPESKPFVMEGDTVKADTVLCIIEAMKVLNEIKAEQGGKVVQILVENGEAVEYGQPLFVIQSS
ncbi:MAG: acetyl-CoA carboxylase biotin carboxyl carrier protein [Planctomycetes bacterium]|nr:acetyl-CoA carboxylase biotin carboxyl carrier protein [Planctomycetota bacterium]